MAAADLADVAQRLAHGGRGVALHHGQQLRAQPLDSQVLTPDGFRRFGSLKVGDLVTGSDGLPTPVIGIYPQGRKQARGGRRIPVRGSQVRRGRGWRGR